MLTILLAKLGAQLIKLRLNYLSKKEKENEVFSIVRCLLAKSQIDKLSSSMKLEKLKIEQTI